ncbi:MAG: ABC transporter ATP-binding protein [Dethiobacter sp.]|nr:ABC transporter ATP-binding protein [Dethiobacter sp.]
MLKVSGLTTKYGVFEAIRDINLEIEKGEFVCILGANGAGKTTLMNTISGLVKPAAGSIIFEGQDITTLPAHKVVGRGISLCPEGRQLFPLMTVEKNLNLGGLILRKDLKKVRKNMDLVFEIFPVLKERRKQLAGTMSGGEQQTLALARALMSEPALLLIDEPSLGLAPLLIQRIARAISEINAMGTTILLVEQNASMALNVSGRGYIVDCGQISMEGTSYSLKNNELVKKAYIGA